MNNMVRQGTRADNIIIQAVANSLNVTISIIESNANFSPVTIVNPVNTNWLDYWPYTRISLCVYNASIEFYYPEITYDSGLIQKSVSSHEDRVEVTSHKRSNHNLPTKRKMIGGEQTYQKQTTQTYVKLLK